LLINSKNEVEEILSDNLNSREKIQNFEYPYVRRQDDNSKAELYFKGERVYKLDKGICLKTMIKVDRAYGLYLFENFVDI
jgi:hypothetical protein